jgi:hypothetical protein
MWLLEPGSPWMATRRVLSVSPPRLLSAASLDCKQNLLICSKQDNSVLRRCNLTQQSRTGHAAAGQIPHDRRLGDPMLWTITIILFVLWLLGLVSGYTLSGWIHILLVLAIIVLIFNLLSGRRAL